MPPRIYESKKQAFESYGGFDEVLIEKLNNPGNPGPRDDSPRGATIVSGGHPFDGCELSECAEDLPGILQNGIELAPNLRLRPPGAAA